VGPGFFTVNLLAGFVQWHTTAIEPCVEAAVALDGGVEGLGDIELFRGVALDRDVLIL